MATRLGRRSLIPTLRITLRLAVTVERFVGLEEARPVLGQLAEEAATGDEVWLTKHGKPLAVLLSRDAYIQLRQAPARAGPVRARGPGGRDPPPGGRGRARSGDRGRGSRGRPPQRLMRIGADTNTLVSGFGWGGPPGQVVDTVLSGQVTLVTSPALLGELARVLAYPNSPPSSMTRPRSAPQLRQPPTPSTPQQQSTTVLADEPDNRVPEAAAAGRADLIVTGDKAVQKLGSRGIPIVSAAQFVAQLQRKGHTGPSGPSGQAS